MTKIIAIHGGSDWYDAFADYVILPAGMDIEKAAANRRKWYKDVYRPAVRQGKRPKCFTLSEWLLFHGAREPTEDELEIFCDD